MERLSSTCLYLHGKQLGVHNLHMESDAQKTINLIVEYTNVDRPHMTLIIDCRKMLLKFKKVKICHIAHMLQNPPKNNV